MSRLIAVCAVVCVVTAVAAGSGSQPPAGPAGDLYQAIRRNDLARLKTLVVSREAANAPGPFGETPLMDAATAGSEEAMAFLIDKGAAVDAQNPFGTTALIMSATDAAKVRLLLERGAQAS